MGRLVALYRNLSYSPLQHRTNDTAIMDATVARLAAHGWQVEKVLEPEVEQGRVPEADLYVNMCQGPLASEHLVPIEEANGAVVVNRATSVLNCHRHRLVSKMATSGLAFPRTLIVNTHIALPREEQLIAHFNGQPQIWIKRGDVHAERPEDVVAAKLGGVPGALAAFAARQISYVAVQEHVPGPVIKFYGVADGSFFRFYNAEQGAGAPPPEVDPVKLQALAFQAAALLGLEVFGGDAVVPTPDHPVLIDLNDWPSFASFRDEAAWAIAAYIHERASSG